MRRRAVRSAAVWGVLAGVLLVSGAAEARNFRVSQLPNGGLFGCGLCHQGGAGGAPRNAFGLQVEASLGSGDISNTNVVWAELGALDADGDGYTNGEELGDPEGGWRIGQEQPQRNVGDPNNPAIFPLPCGNGVLDEGEACDRLDLQGASCTSLGYVSGSLRCGMDCQFDVAVCSNCGNGALDGREQCDGAALDDASCQSIGFGRGVLACLDTCEFDTALCSDCGNARRDGVEQCDGDDLDGQTCLSRGYQGGLLGCDADCLWDVGACEGDPSLICGDAVISGTEDCDGANLNGATCASRGLGEGELACRVDCTFDTGGCTSCGNGALDEGEPCDGAELAGATCQSEGFEGGTLACAGCRLDTSGCTGGSSNNTPGNNTPGNNTPGNNSPGNNSPGNNSPDTNNGTGGAPLEPQIHKGCAAAPGRGAPPLWPLLLVGAGLIWRRRRG